MNEMPPVHMPLRYKISDWRQLNQCKSNNSKHLHVCTTVFFNDERLNGLRIKVDHDTFGTLFACVVQAKGRIISNCDRNYQSFEFELTPAQICEELRKYGFDIEYNPVEHLPGDIINLLMTVNNLGFDKLRVIGVKDANTIRSDTQRPLKTYQVVAFNSEHLEDWLDAGYITSAKQFQKAMNNGWCFNVTGNTNTHNKHYNWSWLWNMVVNIDDVIADNAGALSRR